MNLTFLKSIDLNLAIPSICSLVLIGCLGFSLQRSQQLEMELAGKPPAPSSQAINRILKHIEKQGYNFPKQRPLLLFLAKANDCPASIEEIRGFQSLVADPKSVSIVAVIQGISKQEAADFALVARVQFPIFSADNTQGLFEGIPTTPSKVLLRDSLRHQVIFEAAALTEADRLVFLEKVRRSL